MKSISNYKSVKSVFLFEIGVSLIFLIALLVNIKAMGLYVLIGFGVILIFSAITFLKHHYYRALFKDEHDNYYMTKVISKKLKRITIIDIQETLYPNLYRVKIRYQDQTKTYYTSKYKEP